MLSAGRARRKRALVVAVTVVSTVSLALVAVALPSLSSSSQASGVSSSESEAGAQPALLTLAPAAPVIAPESGDIEFVFEATNTTTQELAESRVALFVSPSRVTAQPALAEALTRTSLPEDVAIALGSDSIAALGPNDRQSVTFTVDTATLGLPLTGAAGVYVAYASFHPEGMDAQLTATPFVWQGTGTTVQTPLHTIVPLLFPSTVDGMPTPAQLAELTSAGGLLSQNLAAAQSQSSTLAIDPRIIVAIRALGARAPDSATEFLARLSTSTNSSFALQYADADLSAQGQLGLETPLLPEGFSFYANTSPLADFSNFTYTIPAVAWPRQDSVTDSSLNFIRQSGFSTVLLSENNLSLANSTSAALTDTRVISLNGACERLSAPLVSDTSAAIRASASAQLVSELALINQSSTSTVPITCAVNRGEARQAEISTVFELLTQLPWLKTASFAEIAGQAGSASIANAPLPAERLEALQQSLTTEPEIDEVSAVLQQPRYLVELQRLRILEFFATSVGVGSPDYEQVTAAFFERDAQTLNGVHVTPVRQTNLVGSSSRIPVQVSNGLPFPAAVSAEVAPANFGLVVEEPAIELTQIEQNSSVNLTVPVRARVSAGQSALIVSLFAQNGQLADEEVLPIVIRSSWESIALITLGILVAGFFGFGIWRSVRARKAPGFAQDAESNSP